MSAPQSAARTLAADRDMVSHQLRIWGWNSSQLSGDRAALLLHGAARDDSAAVQDALRAGRSVVIIRPRDELCVRFGISMRPDSKGPPAQLRALEWCRADRPAWDRARQPSLRRHRIRTLHEYSTFQAPNGVPVAVDAESQAAWMWVPVGTAGLLLVGTDLAGDLVRYRQGDPAAADGRPKAPLWGYPGERPVYLFEAQRSGEPSYARHADEWTSFLSDNLCAVTGLTPEEVLPGAARGAIVVTGDDDVAEAEHYRRQLSVLSDLPVTYFIHDESRHSRASLDAICERRSVHLGLHPDALDAPALYPEKFSAQRQWFESLTGVPPAMVRNHGFLNDGYWGHLRTWLAHGVRLSSNLPGFDGTVLNGSLLPGRLAYDGSLTPHWSILTAIGDGVVFVNNWTDTRAEQCVYDAADAISSRGLPGVLVLNLHPVNIQKTYGMHAAALELARSGFVAWNLRDCLEWFERRDGTGEMEDPDRAAAKPQKPEPLQ